MLITSIVGVRLREISFNHAIADWLYNLLFPDKTVIKMSPPKPLTFRSASASGMKLGKIKLGKLQKNIP
jgi:hypothetical protein